MDPQHFDTVIRSLAPHASRRGLLATVLSGLLITLPAWPNDTVRAGKKQRKKGRKRGRKRPYHPPKRPQASGCSAGACSALFTTPADRDYCEFICRQCDGNDPRQFCIVEGDPFDPARVAVCCVKGAECCGDTCCGGDPRLPGLKCCGGQCRNTHTNRNHCGRCNHPCAGNQECVGGECVGVGPPPCDGGTPPWCDAPGHRFCDGTCVNVQTAPSHCGGCCQRCPEGWLCCDGICVDSRNDPNHCHGCHRACDADQTCEQGYCVRR